jgi:magnesium transporter
MIGNLLQPELKELIRERDFNRLRETLADFPAADIAEILADMEAADKAVLLRILHKHEAAEVFEYLSVEDQESLLRALGSEEVAKILNELAPDDRTALLEELPAPATQKLLQLLQPEERKVAVGLLGYPRGSVGRRMTPRYVSIQQGWTVAQVLEHLRRVGRDQDTLNQMYVVDERGRLVARVRLRELVVAELATPVVELLEQPVNALNVTDDQETAIAAFQKYDLTVIPVVDSHGCLVGVVTVDDILDVAEREATEDMQRLGGMEALDAPYLTIGLTRMIRKRAGWLALLFLGEMLTATAMGYFEAEIEKAVVLSLFIPLIISSGGNSGSQATSLIIRAMAVGDVALRDWWRVLWRELVAGMALGAVLAAIALVRILAWPTRAQLYGPHYVLIAATVACSLIGVVLFGSIMGAMLPFMLRRIGFDPAVSSAPLVATLVDVTGLVIYFSVAYSILHSHGVLL